MRYNKAKFKKFLRDNVEAEYWDFNAYCSDLETQYNNTGFRQYELSKWESKSGNTELFYY